MPLIESSVPTGRIADAARVRSLSTDAEFAISAVHKGVDTRIDFSYLSWAILMLLRKCGCME